jgi:hypothetical protein
MRVDSRIQCWLYNQGYDELLDFRRVEPSSYQYPEGRWEIQVRRNSSAPHWVLAPYWIYPKSLHVVAGGLP